MQGGQFHALFTLQVGTRTANTMPYTDDDLEGVMQEAMDFLTDLLNRPCFMQRQSAEMWGYIEESARTWRRDIESEIE